MPLSAMLPAPQYLHSRKQSPDAPRSARDLDGLRKRLRSTTHGRARDAAADTSPRALQIRVDTAVNRLANVRAEGGGGAGQYVLRLPLIPDAAPEGQNAEPRYYHDLRDPPVHDGDSKWTAYYFIVRLAGEDVRGAHARNQRGRA